MNAKNPRAAWLAVAIAVAAIVVVAVPYFVFVAPYPARGCEEWLESDFEVEVRRESWGLAFVPRRFGITALVIYPGARVSFEAYAPLARDIAGRGFPVLVVDMPFGLAALQPDKALLPMDAYPMIKYWVVGGHSLGGAMAARFAHEHLDRVTGLVLLGAYPGDDLSKDALLALSIIGTEDRVVDREAFERTKAMMPSGTRYNEITGGNHAQFGWYGPQAGDGEATITEKEQVFMAAGMIARMLQALEYGNSAPSPDKD